MMQIRIFCVIAAAFLLAACGGGGSNSINMTPQTSRGESQTAFSQARSVTQTANILAKGANSLKRIFQEDGEVSPQPCIWQCRTSSYGWPFGCERGEYFICRRPIHP